MTLRHLSASFFLACLSPLTPSLLHAALEVKNPRCEYLANPLGIDETQPRLSWVVESAERGETQTAWQILVASTPEALASDNGDLWDSGKVAGDATSQIVYDGAALASRAVCHWKVRSWNKDDQPSGWSEPALWTMGLLEPGDWSAEWIDGMIPAPPDDGSPLPTILEARYEAVNGSGFRDVAALLSDLVAEGVHILSVNNTFLGPDPAYNSLKQLRVRYERGGQVAIKTFPEDSLVVLPTDLPVVPSVTLVAARYESVSNPANSRDVLADLDQRAAAGPFSVVVNNANFGPDPAYNQAKQLRITYEIDGETATRIVSENTTFSYPLDLPPLFPVTLTTASYEAIDGSASRNVLANLVNRAANGSFALLVNNANLGGDPAPNRVKRLRLEYELDGESHVKYISELTTLNYPQDLTRPTAVPHLRKSFELAKPVAKATAYATALGIYELSLNGDRVGDHILASEWTEYTKRLRYQTYDVTSLISEGENVIGAQVAHGWYSGHIGNGGYQYWGGSPALLVQLEIDYEDGTRETVITDGSWKMGAGALTYTDFMMGEDYDARRELHDWDVPGFDDSEWSSVIRRSESPRIMSSQVMEPVRKLMEITPKTLSEPAPGKWTYDLGQNMVGVLQLKITAEAGTRIVLRHGERLNPDGTLYTANLRGAPSVDTYICKGGGEEIWQPKFTFHGFQYVELTGVSSRPPLDAITGIVIGSDTPWTGEFSTSDPQINQLQSNIEWGQRGNFLSVPTDCPQRDERLGWLGDAQVFVRTATFNADVAAFFTKWMTDVKDAQRANGAFTDVAPYAGPSIGTPAWGDAGVICPWTIYQAYGDTRILETCYDSMKQWVEYCRTNTTGHIRDRNRGSDYGDWLSIEADTNKELLATAYYAYSTHLLSRTAAVLGHTADADAYAALFQNIKTAFINKYVNATTGALTGNTQAAYAMALKFDLLPENLREAAAQHLVDDIAAKGNHLSTGFVGVGYLLPTLTAMGRTDTAYTLLHQDTFPSWLFSIKHGATTIWERWDGWTPENGFQSTIMNSFNHYSLGSCGEWLFASVAGIDNDPEAPGFKKIIIRPQPGGNLASARGSLRSIHGRIATSWRTYEGGFVLHAEIPANTTATVYLPASEESEVRESGKPVSEAAGVTFLRLEDGAAVFAVESGRYHFTTGSAAEPDTATVSRNPNEILRISLATLLGEEADLFLGVDSLSIEGATLTVEDGSIVYTPRPGINGPDSFTYTLRTAGGGITTRTVHVTLAAGGTHNETTLLIEILENGSRRILFSGVPGRTYRIQSSENLQSDSWTDRDTVEADEAGLFEFIDPQPLPPSRFYCAVHP